MGYAHVAVSEVVTQQPAGDNRLYLDGVPVKPEVYDFGNKLRTVPAFRGCKFGILRSVPLNSDYTFSEVYTYFPNQLYVMGTIGYRDCSVGDKTRTAFFVTARGVDNNKYRWSRKERYMVLTQDVNKAVVNAKKYLRPYTPADIAGVTAEVFTSSVQSASYEYRRKSVSAHNDLRGAVDDAAGVITQELLHLYYSGHTFRTPEAYGLVKSLVEATDELKEVSGKLFHISLVFVHKSPIEGVEPSVVVVGGPPEGVSIVSGSSVISRAFNDKRRVSEATSTYAMSELPEALAGKVSVLNMVENETFVEGVGFKYNESIFYVMA